MSNSKILVSPIYTLFFIGLSCICTKVKYSRNNYTFLIYLDSFIKIFTNKRILAEVFKNVLLIFLELFSWVIFTPTPTNLNQFKIQQSQTSCKCIFKDMPNYLLSVLFKSQSC